MAGMARVAPQIRSLCRQLGVRPVTSSTASFSLAAAPASSSAPSAATVRRGDAGRRGRFQLGIIGLGAIGKDVLQLCIDDATLAANLHVPAALVRRPRTEMTANGTLITSDAEAFFDHKFDAVLEVAGHNTVVEHGVRVLEGGANFIVTSVGAFSAHAQLLDSLRDAAVRGGTRLTIPSAGIGALDILAAAAVGGLDRVKMVVRKDPSAWYGTVAEDLFDLGSITDKSVNIFEGTAREGAALYPQNVNISAAVALAGIGLDKTELLIVADPTIDTHVCEVSAWGAFGHFSFSENVAVSEHRKTGKIVAMAVVKTVRQLVSPVVVGH